MHMSGSCTGESLIWTVKMKFDDWASQYISYWDFVDGEYMYTDQVSMDWSDDYDYVFIKYRLTEDNPRGGLRFEPGADGMLSNEATWE